MPALIIEGRTTAMDIATLGLDLGKRVVHVVGLDRAGSIELRRRVSRDFGADADGEPAALRYRP